MGSINRVTLLGRLGKDPELKNTNSGTQVCNLSLATSERRPDGAGGYQESTEWHRCVAFGKTAEICAQYLKKGHQTVFEGKLQTREYEKNGEKRYSTEVVVLSVQLLDQKTRGDEEPSKPYAKREAVPAAASRSWAPADDADSDIPF